MILACCPQRAIVCAAWGARGRTAAIIAFAVQLAVNLAWSPVFFGMQQISTALIVIAVLDVLVIVTIVLLLVPALINRRSSFCRNCSRMTVFGSK